MKKNWKIILLLVVVLVLYIICVVQGSRQSNEKSPSGTSDFGDQSVSEWMDENMPSWTKNLQLIPRPKLELKSTDLIYQVLDPEAANGCNEALLKTDPPRFSFQLAKPCKTLISTSGSKDKYRDAKFNVAACTQGVKDAATILKVTYLTLNGKGEDLRKQVWPPGMKYDPKEAAFTILEHPGQLVFEYSGAQPCVVTLE